MKTTELLRGMAGLVFVVCTVAGYQYGEVAGAIGGALAGLFCGVWFIVARDILQHLQHIGAALERSTQADGPAAPSTDAAKAVAYGINPQVPAPQRILSPEEVSETVAAMRAAQPKYRS